METFLTLEGFTLEMTDEDAYDFVNRIAQGEFEKAEIAERLRAGMKKLK